MPAEPAALEIEVINITGHCPVHRVGDRFFIRSGYQLVCDQPLCMHALQALAPFYAPLSRGISPAELGLAGYNGEAYIQCPDPQRYTGGGTVTFCIRRKA